MNCLNCKRPLSCGCQKRKASDGREVCSNCITNYENNLKLAKQATPTQTSPKNVKVLYNSGS